VADAGGVVPGAVHRPFWHVQSTPGAGCAHVVEGDPADAGSVEPEAVRDPGLVVPAAVVPDVVPDGAPGCDPAVPSVPAITQVLS
jgi:hypothetical protein